MNSNRMKVIVCLGLGWTLCLHPALVREDDLSDMPVAQQASGLARRSPSRIYKAHQLLPKQQVTATKEASAVQRGRIGLQAIYEILQSMKNDINGMGKYLEMTPDIQKGKRHSDEDIRETLATIIEILGDSTNEFSVLGSIEALKKPQHHQACPPSSGGAFDILRQLWAFVCDLFGHKLVDLLMLCQGLKPHSKGGQALVESRASLEALSHDELRAKFRTVWHGLIDDLEGQVMLDELTL